MESRSKYPTTENREVYRPAMLPHEQQHSMRFRTQRMDPMMHGNAAGGMQQLRHQEYGMMSFPHHRNGRHVSGMPYYNGEQMFPLPYEHYGAMPTDLNFPTFSNRNHREQGYVDHRMDGKAGGMYQQLEAMGQQPFPSEYMMSPEQINYLHKGRNGNIQGTAMPPVGPERRALPGHHPYLMQRNQAMAHPAYQGVAGNYRSRRAAAGGQSRPDPLMRQGMDSFFNEEQSNQQRLLRMARGGPRQQQGQMQSMPYGSKPPNWHTHQNAAARGMVAPGMSAHYDPMYSDRGGLYPSHRPDYSMHRQMMAQVPTRQRAMPNPPRDSHQMQMLPRTAHAPFAQDSAPFMPNVASTNSRASDKDEAEGLVAFRKMLVPLYHELEEALSICYEAFKTHRDLPTQKCIDGLQNVLKFMRHVSNDRQRAQMGKQWCTLIPDVRNKAVALIRESRKIKAHLESPHSANSTAHNLTEEHFERPTRQERTTQVVMSSPFLKNPDGVMLAQTPAVAAQLHDTEAPLNAPGKRDGSDGMQFEDANEGNCRKEDQKAELSSRFKLHRRLGNEHPSQRTEECQIPPQELRRKRELTHPNDAVLPEHVPSPREIRRKLNSDTKDTIIQVGVQKSTKIKLTSPNEEHHDLGHLPAENDNNQVSVGEKPRDDDLPSSAELDDLLQQLVFANTTDESSDIFRDLKLDDDECKYDRDMLEALASKATITEDMSNPVESIPQQPFPQDKAILKASEVEDGQEELEGWAESFPAVFEAVHKECEVLREELQLEPIKIQPLQKSDSVEVVVEVEGARNKEGVFDWRRAIKLILGSSYPEDVPAISFSVLPRQKAADFARHVFLNKVMDTGLTSITEIFRLWFNEVCPSHFEAPPVLS